MKRILIIRLSAMGDVAMTAPVVEALVKQSPGVQVTILTTSFLRPFFRNVPNAEFVEVDLKGRHKGVFGVVRLWREIRKHDRIDQVADLHDVLRSKILRRLFRLSGTPVTIIDKGRKGKKALTRFRHKILKPLKPTPERYADVFRKLGYAITLPEKLEHQTSPLPEPIRALSGEKKGIWIGIAPFAQHQGKIYPQEKMESVVETLSRKAGVRLFLFGGGKAEQAVTEAWEAKYPSTVSVIGKIRLAEELDLISNLDVMVSMDSSAMHMASLVGIPTVSVWGATHPYAGFMGIGQSLKNAVQLNLPCRPCSVYGNKPCRYGDYRCMNRIEPKKIIEHVITLTHA